MYNKNTRANPPTPHPHPHPPTPTPTPTPRRTYASMNRVSIGSDDGLVPPQYYAII